MQGGILAVFHGFFPGNADRVAFDLDLQIGFPDTWEFRNDNKTVVFAEYIKQRIGAASTGA
jgi:hypothetical protein